MKRSLRAIGPGLACIGLFLLVIALSVFQTARETDRVDAEHSRATVEAAVAMRAMRLGAFAEDNAFWDDMAQSVYGPILNQEFIDSSFASSTEDGVNYDAVYILDATGQLVYAIEDGNHTTRLPSERFGDAIPRLASELASNDGHISTVTAVGEGLALVGMSNIRPTDPALSHLVPTAGHYRLIMSVRVSDPMLAEMSNLLQLKDLAINGSAGQTSAPIKDRWGRNLGSLSWTQPHHGWLALKRTLPLMAVSLVGAFIVLGLLYRQGMRTVYKLKKLTLTDALTGLPNRRALYARLADATSDDRGVALALLNLDGFKRINDQYGHEVGDNVLRQSSAELQRLQQRGFWIARLGGDEFALVVTGPGCDERIQRAAGRVLAFANRPLKVEDRSISVAASLGLALGKRGDDAAELVRRADVALHAAKSDGRRRANWYDPQLDERRAMLREIEADLRTGLDASELYLVYQPLFGSDGMTMVGLEALLRWRSATRGEVSPDLFVPVAEESGLIDRIGLIALRRACTDAMRWPHLKMAVNVSAAQLRSPGFSASVARVLAETGMPPERLELEITETFIVGDPVQASEVLGELKALGLTLALDDFGAGYASIGFLRQYRFGKLKIDKSLIADIEHSESSRAILQASVTIARAMDMDVTAEGIETQAQATLMRIVGCDQLQGWLFDRAMTADQIDDRLAETASLLQKRA